MRVWRDDDLLAGRTPNQPVGYRGDVTLAPLVVSLEDLCADVEGACCGCCGGPVSDASRRRCSACVLAAHWPEAHAATLAKIADAQGWRP